MRGYRDGILKPSDVFNRATRIIISCKMPLGIRWLLGHAIIRLPQVDDVQLAQVEGSAIIREMSLNLF